MASWEEINEIIRKIAEGTATDKEKEIFFQMSEDDERINIQFAKQINNIREGKDNHFGDRSSYSNDNQIEVIQRSREEKLFLEEVKKEINGRLSISLFVDNTEVINLNKELQQELVNCPWTQDIKSIPNFKKLNSEESTVLEIFEHTEIAGKLLIVGEPGAGKTTTLRELAKQLVIKAEKDTFAPVPVLINLASWQYKKSIYEWILETICIEYRRSISTIKQWLIKQKLLLMLDGLDELEPSVQELCIRAINTFLSQEDSPSSLVVCSRREEYLNCEIKLNLNGAVCLLPLKDRQIKSYLQQINNVFLWQTFERDRILLELIRVPLFLNIAIVALQDISSPEKWEKIDSSEERLKYLWNRYISQRLNNNNRELEKQVKWLSWIAQQLSKKFNQQEYYKNKFVVAQLQPCINLDTNKKRNYSLIIFLIILIIIELSIYFKNNLTIENIYDLFSQFIIIIILVLIEKQLHIIQPLEKIFTTPKIAKMAITTVLISGFISLILYYKLNYILLIITTFQSAYFIWFIFSLLFVFSRFSEIIMFSNKILVRLISSFYISNKSIKLSFLVIFLFFYLLGFRIITYLYYNLEISIIPIFIAMAVPTFWYLLCFAFFGRVSWKWFFSSIIPSLLIIISLLYYSLITYFFGYTEKTWYVGIISGVIFGQVVNYALIRKTYNGLTISIPEKANYSNQGIRKSFVNASVIGITTCLIVGLIKNFSQGVSIGLIFWLISGGIACIQHFSLRLVLYFSGYIPWDYTKFLNYATDRTLLQRIGGSYVFIHSLLQEHLVKMSIETDNK